MKKSIKTKLLCLALGLVAGLASAQTRYEYSEPTDMKVAFDRAIEESKSGAVLMAFDIDNTLLATDQDLGSEQWYEGEAKALEKVDKGLFARRLNQLLDAYAAVNKLTTTRLTQNDIPGLIKQLPAGVKVVAITSRGSVMADATINAFNDNGLSFNGFFPGDIRYAAGGRDVLCRRGICLTGGANKGEALVGFMNAANDHPRAVIFVDNDPTPFPPGPHDPNNSAQGKHHPRVRKSCADAGIPVLIACRYSALDVAEDRYEAGDKAVAVAQLREFRKSGSLISNAQAEKIAAGSPASKEDLAKQMSLLLYGVENPGRPDPK